MIIGAAQQEATIMTSSGQMPDSALKCTCSRRSQGYILSPQPDTYQFTALFPTISCISRYVGFTVVIGLP